MFLVRGKTTVAVPYYGVGVFMPIMVMGLAIRKHILADITPGATRTWGSRAATFAAGLAGIVFIGQIVGKWKEGGWVVLISFSMLILAAHAMLISPIGYRDPKQNSPHRAREGARAGLDGVHRGVAIAEDAGISLFDLRARALIGVTRLFELFGVRRPVRYEPVPVVAGDYDHAVHSDHPDAPVNVGGVHQEPAEPWRRR